MNREELDLWHRGVELLRRDFARLSPAARARITALCSEISSCRESLYALSPAGAGAICAGCGGECCRSGKYHVRIADILVFFAAGEEAVVPSVGAAGCPFAGEEGCTIPPSRRPFPCITFNCDLIEAGMTQEELDLFYRLEKSLRSLYNRVENLCSSLSAGRVFLIASGKALAAGRPLLHEPLQEKT